MVTNFTFCCGQRPKLADCFKVYRSIRFLAERSNQSRERRPKQDELTFGKKTGTRDSLSTALTPQQRRLPAGPVMQATGHAKGSPPRINFTRESKNAGESHTTADRKVRELANRDQPLL
jgi:hypothetical protein